MKYVQKLNELLKSGVESEGKHRRSAEEEEILGDEKLTCRVLEYRAELKSFKRKQNKVSK